ncbi:RhoGAP domain containing protein [Metarhizium album ARSEF 1941]|uniref:RhoGAP domain containing protein n=1 Tax=Metarhizium album (strain ARSEF 1941) TaxID=1081103 RepID=A0A0B2WYY6_METAS|nr:RhoGAP domain containing protein [Metarhizium album ARSEF 1941]KHN98754.1 RhoGAP domain containing protein [Metarhizium album ARSEF 1941]
MADLRGSNDDDDVDAVPHSHQHQHQQDRLIGSPTHDPQSSQPDADGAGGTRLENSSNGKQSAEARDVGASQQGPAAPTAAASGTEAQAKPAVDPAVAKHVNDVMTSELGIPTLLNRLKQSVASAKEFALFLKKRSVLEDDHAQSLRKLCRLTQDNSRRPEHRQGTFSKSYDEMVFIHDRMAENGSQFAASLHQMHEDLVELVANGERARKMWKANGLAAEHKVADLEQVMRKAKAKYDSLAEEYDRARTGEARQGGKVLGAFKAHKSAAQHEGDLLRKVQAADQTYASHVQSLQTEKSHLEKSARPEAVKALRELISETDSAVTLQMQKFAAFNEKLLLGNGLIVSPFKTQGPEGAGQPRSLRQAVASIDNEKDFNDFVAGQHTRIQPYTEVKYERNPLLMPNPSSISQPFPQSMPTAQPGGSAGPPPEGPSSLGVASRSSVGQFGAMGGVVSSQGPPAQQGGITDSARPYAQSHGRSFSQGNMLSQQVSSLQQQFSSRNSAQSAPRYGSAAGSQGPPQLGALSFQGSQPSPKSSTPPQGAPSQPPTDPRSSSSAYGGAPPPAYAPASESSSPTASKKLVFGTSLSRLYERDGLAVPMVVYQCIQAVDLFGLGLEGIYRQSGSHQLTSGPESSNPALDFTNPENFYHDVNSVTGLLKQFFRDLPDPLLTGEHHDAFVKAAKHEDDILRRDSLHAIINALPDPNYATLRAMTLHLYRVMDNAHVNRMNSHNLAVIFGPTLMGSDPSTAIADAGWQIKVIDTILQNTYQIFEED